MQLYHTRRKTAHMALQGLFQRFAPFYCRRYQTGKSGYNTICATLERITAPQHLQHIPDTNATPDATQVSTAAYYNKVYKGAGVQQIADHASPAGVSVSTCTRSARRLAIWHRSAVRAHRLAPSTRRGSPAAGRGGRRGTIGGYRRSSFRAFAR